MNSFIGYCSKTKGILKLMFIVNLALLTIYEQQTD